MQGKVVVITGASSGVGRSCVREFARQGARIALIARGRDGIEAAEREVEELGGRALVVPLDVADAGAVESAAAAVEAQLGPIDVWVNNAMLSVFSPDAELSVVDVPRATEVTYLGYVHGTLSALRRMRPRDHGVIIQVGSALAYRAIPFQAAYCAAKHAIEGFTEPLRCELLHDGSNVRVTMVQLPALNTPHFSVVRTRLPRHPQPVPPIFQPELAARAVAFAAEHPRRELWIAGSTVRALLGNKFVPGLLDHYLGRTAYDAQQAGLRAARDRSDNLTSPLPGDRGAHGIFDREAHSRSLQFLALIHARLLAAGAVAAAAAAALVMRREPR